MKNTQNIYGVVIYVCVLMFGALRSVGIYVFLSVPPFSCNKRYISTGAESEGDFVATRSEIERRLLYAAAVLRCVNGLVEPGQRGSSAASVQSLARNVGLPAWVVDMRHEISHKELPSLSTLRLVSDFLLNYLQRCAY